MSLSNVCDYRLRVLPYLDVVGIFAAPDQFITPVGRPRLRPSRDDSRTKSEPKQFFALTLTGLQDVVGNGHDIPPFPNAVQPMRCTFSRALANFTSLAASTDPSCNCRAMMLR